MTKKAMGSQHGCVASDGVCQAKKDEERRTSQLKRSFRKAEKTQRESEMRIQRRWQKYHVAYEGPIRLTHPYRGHGYEQNS